MGQVDEIVRRAGGTVKSVPVGERWRVAGIVADHFPLDRESPYPRPLRQVGHWFRLLVLDRPLTNDDRSAILTLGEMSVPATIAICLFAGVVGPSLPRWVRRSLLVALVVWAVRDDNARRFVGVRRLLREHAPDSLVVSDFVALQPGAGSAWLVEALDAVGRVTPYAVLLPGRADPRRNAARERLYTSRVGLRVAARADVYGETVTVLVRDGAVQPAG
ncbi:MAG: hypothetical protein U0W40_04055 [Acidimicrobiia bacterium]